MTRRILVVLALAVGLAACGSDVQNAAGTLIEQVRLGDPLAGATYEENKALLESAEALPIWLEALEGEDSPQVKEWAAQILGNIGDPAALPALVTAMSGSRSVRDAAVAAILQFGDDQAVEAFAEALTAGGRDAKAVALAQVSRLDSAEAAVSAVAQIAAGDDEMLSHPAMNTLADIGTVEAAAALGSLALDAAAPAACRGLAINNLGRIGSEASAAQLDTILAALDAEEGVDELIAQTRALQR